MDQSLIPPANLLHKEEQNGLIPRTQEHKKSTKEGKEK
jgi:hypothetical protein